MFYQEVGAAGGKRDRIQKKGEEEEIEKEEEGLAAARIAAGL